MTNLPHRRFNPRIVGDNSRMTAPAPGFVGEVPLIGAKPQTPPLLDIIGNVCHFVFSADNFSRESVRIRQIIATRENQPETAEETYTLALIEAAAIFQETVRSVTLAHDKAKIVASSEAIEPENP